MEYDMLEQHLENIDQRLTRVEQTLPTLAAKEDLKSLATKAELQAAIAPLATKDDVAELRRHMHVLTESLRGDIHPIAAHVASERPKDTGA